MSYPVAPQSEAPFGSDHLSSRLDRLPLRKGQLLFRRKPFLPRRWPVSHAFKVSVAKEYLSFSSAHFITLAGHQCESLHGHNYRIGVTVEGGVDPECAFVVDFSVLKRIVRPYVQAVDHRVLLPTQNSKLELKQEGERLMVDYLGRERFVFPLTNCALLPISNTTAEMLAEYFAHRVREDLRKEGLRHLDHLEVEVEESAGQSGYYRLSMRD